MSTLTRDLPSGTDGPRAAVPAQPRAHSPWRVPAVIALLAVVGAIAYLVIHSPSYHYRLHFVDAGQLVNGDLVRIGGTPAGTVNAIRLTDNDQAELDVSINSRFGPLRQGTTAQIRAQSLVGVASRYIDISPAPSFASPIADNGVIPTSQTKGIVDIDEVFDALDATTRTGLQRLIRGFATWYDGKSQQANLSAAYFPPALAAYSHLFAQIDADTPTLAQFLKGTSSALGAINLRAPQLTDLVSQAKVTSEALGSDNQALTEALINLPPALREGSATFARLRTQTLPALTRLVDATAPITAPLGPFLNRFAPVLDEAVPTFGLLRQTFDQPGPNNDLYDALLDLPPLAAAVKHDFPRAVKALNQSTPIFEFARPYVPDLVAWVSNWDGIFAPYDANGHYGRTVPVFDAFGFTDDAQGGTLSAKPPFERGSGGALKTGFLYRCPGGAISPPADASAPFDDTGPLTNSHCRTSETIGGTP